MRIVFSTSGRTSSRPESSYSETANCAPGSCARISSSRPATRLAASACRRRRSSRASGTSSAHAKQLAGAGASVAAGPADLLRVRLEPLRQVVVVDVADVRLVDAHAEGDRGDDDVVVGARPPFLHRDAIVGAHARVVGAGGKARRREERGDPERGALQRDVDDRRARRPLAQAIDQQPVSLTRRVPAS